MNLYWTEYINYTLNVNMYENYRATKDSKAEQLLYEIVFRSGRLVNAHDDNLLLETERKGKSIGILIPFTSEKCIKIFNF
ncbi:MAG: hypothetical protein IH618_10625 [Ignavibacteriaceae bacterium]|nr:hypothetical protein [Ignavibacteriaceae bacterium]